MVLLLLSSRKTILHGHLILLLVTHKASKFEYEMHLRLHLIKDVLKQDATLFVFLRGSSFATSHLQAPVTALKV